jgi:2-polyprenyl-3-methyl-5-hydroxy-6-metoxy-1,4-benzoquinol methylase
MSDMTEIEREKLISTAKAAINDDPIAWFDELYDLAKRDSSMIPWARMSPNPIMMDWVRGHLYGGKALIVGCGLGDDAIGLEQLGFQVTAFDISQQCINWCRERFPESSVDWQVADILEPPQQWLEQFDLVVEIHILQAIPDGGIRELAAQNLPKLLSKDGF